MVARLLVFLVGYVMLFSLPLAAIGFAYRRQIAEAWERRQARLAGLRNAKLLAAHADRICGFCLQACVDMHTDCYDHKTGWYHATCMKALLG
jgi:hypothetical protein